MKRNVDLTEDGVFSQDLNGLLAFEEFLDEIIGKTHPWNVSESDSPPFGNPYHAILLGSGEDRKRTAFYMEEEDGCHCFRCGGILNPWHVSIERDYKELCKECCRAMLKDFNIHPHFDFLFGLGRDENGVRVPQISQQSNTQHNLLDEFL